jgi:hypothetical protein
MFTDLEKKQLRKLNDGLSGDIKIGLTGAGHPQSPMFQEFCDNLVKLVPKIGIVKEDSSPGQPPQILIGTGLKYQALPGGLEMPPFIEALEALGAEAIQISESIKSRLIENNLPATLTVFMASQCTYCPQVISQLIPLSMIDAGVQLIIVDGTLFPEAAQIHQIQSVPTILLDKEFRWTGLVPLDEITDAICTRNPVLLGTTSLESILNDGQASHLAAIMLDAREIFPSIYELLIHDKWSVRLGAMVVMEEIAEENPAMASEAIDPLWEHFERVADQVKGDILYLFGEIGDPRVIPWLAEVTTGEFDDEVKEAAKEALEKLAEINT